MNNNKLFKVTTLYLVGSFFNKAMALLLLPFFTTLLSTSSYGIVSTYNSWVSIVGILISVQFGYTIRNAFVDFKDKLTEYIFSINIFCLSIYLFCCLLITIVSPVIKNNTIIILSICCLTQSFFNSIINIELQKQMMEFDYVKRTCLLALPNLLSAIVGVIILYNYAWIDYWGRIIPMVVVYTSIGGYYFWYYFFSLHQLSPLKIKNYLKYSLGLSLPLILHGLASVILSNIDKTMINYYVNSSETGIYSVAYTMGMVLLAVTSAMESVWIPWFTRKMQEQAYNSINIIGEFYIKLGAVICILSLLCLPECLKLFAAKPYWIGIRIIFPIILASFVIFLFTICANIEYYYKSTKHIAVNTLVACISNIILNCILVPRYAGLGAAYATLVSYIISLIMHYKYSRKLNKKIFGINMYLKPYLITLLFLVIADYLIEFILVRWILAFFILIIFSIYCYKKKNIIYLIKGV